jgi:hypothetical protein
MSSQPLYKTNKNGIFISVWPTKNSTLANIKIENRYQDQSTQEWKSSNNIISFKYPVLIELLTNVGEFCAANGISIESNQG